MHCGRVAGVGEVLSDASRVDHTAFFEDDIATWGGAVAK
jgi:hypothetical protein